MSKNLETPVINMLPRVVEFGQEEFIAEYEHLEDIPHELTDLFDTAYAAAVAIGKEFSAKKEDPLASIADPRGDIQTQRVLFKDKDISSVTVYDNHALGISIADKEKAVSLNPGLHTHDASGNKSVAFQASLYVYETGRDRNGEVVYKPGADIEDQLRFRFGPRVSVAFLMTPPTENKPEHIEVAVRRRVEEGDSFGADHQKMSAIDIESISRLTSALTALTEGYTKQGLEPEASPFFTRESIDAYWNSQD